MTKNLPRPGSLQAQPGSAVPPTLGERLPSYQTAIREREPATVAKAPPKQPIYQPTTPTEYTRDLEKLQIRSESKTAFRRPDPKDEELVRQLQSTSDVDEAHQLVARRIADKLDVFPSDHPASDSDSDDIPLTQRLAPYVVDSITWMRLVGWAKRSLGVKLTPKDLASSDAATLDDAARLIALKFCHAI